MTTPDSSTPGAPGAPGANDGGQQQEPTSPANDTTPPAGADGAGDGGNDDQEPRSEEAKRYRLRLRDAEGQRDQVQGRLDAQRAALIDAACTAGGLDPRLWAAADVDETDLETDSGVLDAALVAERVKTLVGEFGVGGARPPRPNTQQGGQSGGAAHGASWSEVLKGAASK